MMTTITIKNGEKLSRSIFESLKDLQQYLTSISTEDDYELTDAHKKILDERLLDAKNNPDNSISFEELKASITRKHV